MNSRFYPDLTGPAFLAAMLLAAAPPASAGVTMAPLATFSGNGDGWLAPGEDGYTYLGTTNTERGLAFNRTTGHLLLLSRSAGISVRVLNATTAAEEGALAAPSSVTFSGGDLAASMIGVADDGAIYISNVRANAHTSNYKVYRYESEAASDATLFFDSTISGFTGSPRIGDVIDVTGSGLNTRIAAGVNNSTGYLILTAEEGALAGDPPVGVASPVTSFAPAGISSGDFRLGICFGKDGPDHVYGRQTTGTVARRSTYAAGGGAGTNQGNLPVTVTGEAPMDFMLLGGRPLLAVLDVNISATGSPTVRIYDITIPGSPALAAARTNASGLLPEIRGANNAIVENRNFNGNGAGCVAWGSATTVGTTTTATLYAMATNQGIQAFTVTVTPDITPAAIAADPVSAAVFSRGIATFRVSATGTPPLTYQWLKDGQPVSGATSPTLRISPVGATDAGTYSCVVDNAAATPATSGSANLTIVPSVDTTALTQHWQLAPGSRAYLTDDGTQRGVAFDPVKGRIYLATRSPAVSIQVLNASDGAHIGELDASTISGGTFPLNHVGVGSDGRIYAANLADGGTFKIYRWMDDNPGVPAEEIYASSLTGRVGDTFAVRGSGNNTEIIAGTRTGDAFVLFKFDENGAILSYPLTVTGAVNGAFGLGIAFGQGNTVWGKNSGSGLTLATFTLVPPAEPETLPTYTAALTATLGTGAIPGSGGAIAVDPVNGCLAHVHVADSDNVRLYRLPQPFPDPAPATLSLLDQEFFSTDNANANGTGQLAFSGDKLIALNTNNGLACYTVAKPVFVQPEITDVIRSGTDVTFTLKGAAGRTYVIERSSKLAPGNTWTADGTVTLATDTQSVTRAVDPGETKLFWRAREQ